MSDTRTAFSRGGLLCFGIETLLRGPALVRRVLAILLLGWTVLLASRRGALVSSSAWPWAGAASLSYWPSRCSP